jgi:lipopolysaccharide/colanic/teichoic acid biosynthesis glycosyltransferase
VAKRGFDIFFSFLGLLILLPFFLVLAVWIAVDSKGGVLYKQVRVGRHGKDFTLFKLRTMKTGSDHKGLLTIGGKDPRVTRSGFLLRKYKLDELPQLLNVLIGDMSLVGPRPEVRKYVTLYTPEQLQVLYVKPGITDYASIEYSNESELLSKSPNPEKFYIEVIMPEKLRMNLRYIKQQGVLSDLYIIWLTFVKVFR